MADIELDVVCRGMYRYVSKQNVFTGGGIPILSTFSLISEWIIDERTTLSLYSSPYGAVVKLTRGSRFFAMSEKPWQKLRKQIPMMKTPNFKVQLTKSKKVSVRQIGMEQYVCFEEVYSTFRHIILTNYITLDTEQWEEFLTSLRHIDQVLPVKKVVKCPECRDEKNTIQVDADTKRKASRLSSNMLLEIQSHNKNIRDQDMHMCEHCGIYDQEYMVGDYCHCHRVTCQSCEPDGFCKCCGQLTLVGF